MAMTRNMVDLTGFVGRDPQIRFTPGGTKVAKFPLATTERFRRKNSDDYAETTEWHNVVVFGRAAESIETYIRKGAYLRVLGKIQTRSYEKDGNQQRIAEIVVTGANGHEVMFLDRRPRNGADTDAPPEDAGMPDDGIPFEPDDGPEALPYGNA